MAMVMMLFLTRNSAVGAHKRRLYGLGVSAIIFEVIWLVCWCTFPAWRSISA